MEVGDFRQWMEEPGARARQTTFRGVEAVYLEVISPGQPSVIAQGSPMLASILFVTLTNFFVTWAQFFDLKL